MNRQIRQVAFLVLVMFTTLALSVTSVQGLARPSVWESWSANGALNSDPRNRRTLIRVLRARPETKLIASHDLDLVLETCRRVLLIADGTLAADGPARELLRDKALLEANGLELPLCLAGVPDL